MLLRPFVNENPCQCRARCTSTTCAICTSAATCAASRLASMSIDISLYDSPYLNIVILERTLTSERCGEVSYCQGMIRHCIQPLSLPGSGKNRLTATPWLSTTGTITSLSSLQLTSPCSTAPLVQPPTGYVGDAVHPPPNNVTSAYTPDRVAS